MSFGGGGSGASPITAHIHSTSAGEGGALRMNSSTTSGTAIQISGNNQPIEVLM